MIKRRNDGQQTYANNMAIRFTCVYMDIFIMDVQLPLSHTPTGKVADKLVQCDVLFLFE